MVVEFSYVSPFAKIEGLAEQYGVQDILEVIGRLGPEAQIRRSDKVFNVNGMSGMDGWDILTSLRNRLETRDYEHLGLQMVVVTTTNVRARFVGAKPCYTIDLMQRRGKRIVYWWEISPTNRERVDDRKQVEGFEATFTSEDGVEFAALIALPTRKDYRATVDALKAADWVVLSGMKVSASREKKEVIDWLIVDGLVLETERYDGAENILKRLEDWHQLIPMRHVQTGESMFPDEVMLSMMMAVLFNREGLPALNAVYFGPPYTGKTAVCEYLVRQIMRGSFEAATASSGKGWLVTHKEGVSSKIFSERRVMLVDEFFKAASTVGARANYHSYALELNHFMVRHMQLLERGEVDATSGLGVVRGRMKCAFLATENDDEALQRALAKADALSGGPLRRLQIGYVDRPANQSRMTVREDPVTVRRYMTSHFIREFGKTALPDMAALYMYSRRMTEDASLRAPGWWMEGMMRSLVEDVEQGINGVPKTYLPGPDEEVNTRKREKMVDYAEHHQPCMTACWVSAAVMRGWEEAETLEGLRPVFDLRQQKMAEMVVRYFFMSKLRVLEPGMDDVFKGPDSGLIQRR